MRGFKWPVYVVDVHEVGTVPQNEKPIHWCLLTNHTVDTDEDLHRVITGYARRWKVEELHRIWKSGACRIEESQLRSTRSAVKWAIMSIVTAARIERLKTQARSSPETPASLELNAYEIQALILMKRRYAKRTELIPDAIPSIGQAVRWTADLGGYAGHRSSGLPGSVIIRRGLEFIIPVAIALECLETTDKIR